MTSGLPRGISRIDNERNRTHAWVVALMRLGKSYRRQFSDGVHGGREPAYRAAVDCLKRLDQDHPALLRNEMANILRQNNRSGVPGVCRYRSGYWVAL